jgi:hypothetical protein
LRYCEATKDLGARMRRQIPIQGILSISTNNSLSRGTGAVGRVISVPPRSKAATRYRCSTLIRKVTQGDLRSFANVPPLAFKLTSYDHASGPMKSFSRRIPVHKSPSMRTGVHCDWSRRETGVVAQRNGGDLRRAVQLETGQFNWSGETDHGIRRFGRNLQGVFGKSPAPDLIGGRGRPYG